MGLVEEFSRHIEQYKIDESKRILLAISGGVDSMVLLDLAIKLDLNIEVAHVNYNLRGKESIGDKNLVIKVAEENAVDFHLKELNTKFIVKNSSKGLQETARDLRYNWFEELMLKEGFDYLFTAHHLNDSVETFFINLNRGTGLKGLLGINNRKHIHRPLVNCSRNEIEAYAATNKVKYRLDSSNSSEAYFRNWLRLSILKEWEVKNEAFLPRMKKNMEHLRDAQEIIDNQIRQDVGNVKLDVNHPISFNTIDSWGAPKYSLHAILEPFGFTIDQAEEVLLKVKERKQGRTFLSTNYEVLIDRKELILNNRTKGSAKDLKIHLEQLPAAIFSGTLLDIVDNNKQVNLKVKGTQYLDMKMLEFPLEIRKWKDGDRMKPFGMKGSKKISDILINKKISRVAKSETYVIKSGSKIACIIGIVIHDDFSLTERTAKALRITC